MLLNDGELLVFLGDSLTEHPIAVSEAMETQSDELPPVGSLARVDRFESRGWTVLLMAQLSITYPRWRLRTINAGIGGDTSRKMLARLDDVVRHHPDWLLLSAGVVDMRRAFQPERASEAVPLEEYRANIATMVRRAQEGGSRVVLLEPTPHVRPPAGASAEVRVEDVNALTRQYAGAVEAVARETGAYLVPLFETFLDIQATGRAREPAFTLYADDVHLNLPGDLLYMQQVYTFFQVH